MSPDAEVVAEAAGFVDTLNRVILFPFISLLMAVAFLVFIWGCAEYVFGGSNDQAREKGMKHITYGLVGLFIMVSAWSILAVVAGTFGLDDELNCARNPSASGCNNTFNVDPPQIRQ